MRSVGNSAMNDMRWQSAMNSMASQSKGVIGQSLGGMGNSQNQSGSMFSSDTAGALGLGGSQIAGMQRDESVGMKRRLPSDDPYMLAALQQQEQEFALGPSPGKVQRSVGMGGGPGGGRGMMPSMREEEFGYRGGPRDYGDRRGGYDDRRGGYDDRRGGYDDRRGYGDRGGGYDDRFRGYDDRRGPPRDYDDHPRGRFDDRGPPPRGYDDGPRGYNDRRDDDRDPRSGGYEANQRTTYNRDATGGMPDLKDITLLFPIEGIGTIIGKGGTTIRSLQTQSKCNLKLQDTNTLPEGAVERGVTLTGPLESMFEAERLILEKVDEERAGKEAQGTDEKVMKWLIPSDKCGLVIGKRGSGIENIKKETGAHVWVATQYETPQDFADRLVTIRGKEDECEAALERIKDIVGGKPYDADAAGGKSILRWPAKGAAGAAAGMLIGGPNQELVMVPIRSIGVILGSGGSEIKRITGDSGANIQIAQNMFMGDHERAVTINGTPSAREKAKRMLEDCVKRWKEQQTETETEDVCLKMAFPNAMTGHIVGRNGSNIRQIQACGVTVKILGDKPSFSKLCDFRPMMIIGKLKAIFEAQRMIHERIVNAPDHLIEEARTSLPPPEEPKPDDGMGPMGGSSRGDESQALKNILQEGQVLKTMMVDGQKVIVVQAPGGEGLQQGGGGGGLGAMGTGALGTGGDGQSRGAGTGGLARPEIGIMGVQILAQGAEMYLSPMVMKHIIGVNGTTLKQISQVSGCLFHVQEKDEVDPRQIGVRIQIQGTVENVGVALRLVEQTLSSEATSGGGITGTTGGGITGTAGGGLGGIGGTGTGGIGLGSAGGAGAASALGNVGMGSSSGMGLGAGAGLGVGVGGSGLGLSSLQGLGLQQQQGQDQDQGQGQQPVQRAPGRNISMMGGAGSGGMGQYRQF